MLGLAWPGLAGAAVDATECQVSCWTSLGWLRKERVDEGSLAAVGVSVRSRLSTQNLKKTQMVKKGNICKPGLCNVIADC